MPNLESLCQTYFHSANSDQADSQGGFQLNLTKVKAKVVHDTVEWDSAERPSTSSDSAQKVTVERRDRNSEAYGTLSTSKDFRWLTHVKISSDVIKGLNKQVRLPLHPTVQSDLGDSVLIDVSKAESSFEPNVPIDIHTGQRFEQGASANVALVKQDFVNYTGNFKCTVELSGKVMFLLEHEVVENQFVQVCKYLNQNGKLPNNLKVKGDKVTFILKGTVTFKGDYEKIQWQ